MLCDTHDGSCKVLLGIPEDSQYLIDSLFLLSHIELSTARDADLVSTKATTAEQQVPSC